MHSCAFSLNPTNPTIPPYLGISPSHLIKNNTFTSDYFRHHFDHDTSQNAVSEHYGQRASQSSLASRKPSADMDPPSSHIRGDRLCSFPLLRVLHAASQLVSACPVLSRPVSNPSPSTKCKMFRTRGAAEALCAICVATIACEVYLFCSRTLGPLRCLLVQGVKFGAVGGLWMVAIIDERAAYPRLEKPWFVMVGEALFFSLLR